MLTSNPDISSLSEGSCPCKIHGLESQLSIQGCMLSWQARSSPSSPPTFLALGFGGIIYIAGFQEPHPTMGTSFAWKHVPSISAGLAGCSQHTFQIAHGPKVNKTFFFLSNKAGLSNINTQLFLQMCDNMPQTYRALFPRNATNALGFLPWYSGRTNSSKAAWDQLRSWSNSSDSPVTSILL